jgi:putative ABC transport system permease protein
MLLNYIKIAWRTLWKSKVLSSLNMLGLAVAFGAALLLSLTAFHELSYDRFHANRSRLYELYISIQRADGAERRSNLMMPLTPALKKEFPEVKAASRYMNAGSTVRYLDKTFDADIKYVDADFLQLFSFPVMKGDVRRPLESPGNIAVTEWMAKKVFGTGDAVGKQLALRLNDQWRTFTISAVVKDFPDNSSLKFDVLCRFENVPGYAKEKDDWNSSTHEVFVQLAGQATVEAFEKRSRPFISKYFASSIRDLKRDGAPPTKEGDLIQLRLIPFTDIHFNSISSTGGAMSIYFPYMLLLIAAFIVFIACVNFINLAIARAFSRAREIGMRKILGAFRMQLIAQLWGEALLVCLLALVVGVGLAFALLPAYNALFSNKLSLSQLGQPMFLACTVLVFGIVTLLAGGYPAWLIARFNTVQVLKGSVSAGGRSNKMRNMLMVLQFVISSVLICCTLIAWQQLDYLRRKPLGYNREQIISIPVGDQINAEEAIRQMRSRLFNKAGIMSITGTDINMGLGRDGSSGSSVIGFDYKGHAVRSNWRRVDYDYVKTMGLKLVAGRDFSPQYAADSNALVINEKMAQQLGGVNAALGALLPVDDSVRPMEVIGIVKDFHLGSLHHAIGPLSMNIQHSWGMNYIFVKVKPGDLPGSMELIRQAWLSAYPGSSFSASFLDENTNRQYERESRFSRIFISAALLSIIISCMGLFAISVLVMTQRTREIGVRKVLGASIGSIVVLLSGDFIKLVLLSILVASPLAWYLMDQWLQNYAYAVSIHVWVFVLAGGIAVLIALLTVSIQSVRAALMNPVRAIRTE